ncbi:acetylpolyamine aminohydrolase [Saccharospirillum sp. MSK14-1]|uniref:histone deacetylase family protein n=1 Tax=Saccharospirillum sp. MSK14-1 TaxID=1897632 RepID=UPI000D3D49C6|nr:histone deacetylase family protein [Saccharospirillum sp. MSK14-1]PTY38685.1 acetylpolyamine aminohydrolase [Saccharospirillum sp. MSK14-1]
MQCFYSPRQADHSPDTFLLRGEPAPSPEQSTRADVLLAALDDAGLAVEQLDGQGSAALAQRLALVHQPRYLTFLKTIQQRWGELPGAPQRVAPNVHPTSSAQHYPSHPVGQAGWHLHDMACPLGPTSYDGIVASAATAERAAEAVLLDASQRSYALCRPPGHHAGPERAGGFCFLNNAALAASVLRERFARVAIVDVDLHHGNGTQDIFYARNDVWTGSVHADPDGFYPFFWGTAAETGEGAGEGFNRNVPLPVGADGDAFMAGLETLLDGFGKFNAEAVVIALGLDAHQDDPLAGMSLTTADFTRVGKRLAQLTQPMVVVQEGGYPTPALGANLSAFLTGLNG